MKFDLNDINFINKLYKLKTSPTVNNLKAVIGKELSDKYITKNAEVVNKYSGVFRDVFVCGEFAFKFPTMCDLRPKGPFGPSLRSNQKEIKDYNKNKESKILCPILYHSEDAFLIIMPKVLTINALNDKNDKKSKLLREILIRNQYKKHFLYFTTDVHCGNLGYYNNKLVLIDYGS